MRLLLVLIGLAMFAAPVPASAQVQAPAKPQSASLDSEAPPGAPPHWLPSERWVMQHWLPYDEARLYALLGADRGDVWRWLRDDTRSIAGLARARGKDPEALARALVRPWRGRLKEPHRLAVLERRALRTLTQGHLAQHILFHSLHQNAIPDAAPAIFGVGSREEFQSLRRAELSPVQICRLNGLPRSHAEREARRTLRAEVARGVEGQAIPPVQARRLLARQLRQVPRWLAQTRYNGPPPLKLPRASVATASNYSDNAVLARTGSVIAFEGYEAALAGAKTRGEIGVLAGPVGGAESASGKPGGPRRTPRSAYNPAIAADGRSVAFESAEGNLNFAKRYGQMQVFVRDLVTGRTRLASKTTFDLGATEARPIPRSAYNPSVSADGRRVAYESSESGRGRLDVFVRDMRRPVARRVVAPAGARALSEPVLSASGAVLAFSALTGEGSAVFTRDLRAGGDARRVSPPGAEGYEPAVSADGATVAYTVLGAGRRSRVEVLDARTGRRRVVAPAAGDGLAESASASEPSISADGTRVAFVLRHGVRRRSSVYVADLAAGRTTLASRATGPMGRTASGASGHPSISGDGRRVAFTSDAHDLDARKCNSARGIFVRDLTTMTTTLVSRRDGENRYAGPTKGSSTSADLLTALMCA